MSLGTRIASMRGFKRINQDQLGGMVGVTKQTVSGWETGRRAPDADAIRKMCGVFGCSADYLLELSDDPRIVHEQRLK